MRTKIVTFFVFCWAAAALCLVIFAMLSFGLRFNGSADGMCPKTWGPWLSLWGSESGIRFTGIPDVCIARILGSLTWQVGIGGIPIFLIPIGLRSIAGGRQLLTDIGRKYKWSGTTVNGRIKSYLIALLCIACCSYYVYWGYFSSGPIYLRSSAGAAVTVLEITFGPALIILLTSSLIADLLFLISSRNQGVSDE